MKYVVVQFYSHTKIKFNTKYNLYNCYCCYLLFHLKKSIRNLDWQRRRRENHAFYIYIWRSNSVLNNFKKTFEQFWRPFFFANVQCEFSCIQNVACTLLFIGLYLYRNHCKLLLLWNDLRTNNNHFESHPFVHTQWSVDHIKYHWLLMCSRSRNVRKIVFIAISNCL